MTSQAAKEVWRRALASKGKPAQAVHARLGLQNARRRIPPPKICPFEPGALRPAPRLATVTVEPVLFRPAGVKQPISGPVAGFRSPPACRVTMAFLASIRSDNLALERRSSMPDSRRATPWDNRPLASPLPSWHSSSSAPASAQVGGQLIEFWRAPLMAAVSSKPLSVLVVVPKSAAAARASRVISCSRLPRRQKPPQPLQGGLGAGQPVG